MGIERLSIRHSLALSYAQKYTSVLLHFVSMVVIARLMTPSEVGVFAAGAALVALAAVLAEFGQQDYLIQKVAVTPAQTRTAFGVAWASAWLCALVVVVAAMLLLSAAQATLRSVVIVLAAAVALRPFSVLMRAALHRELRFDRLYVVNLTRDIAIVGGSITLVYSGMSALGLAFGLLLEQAVLVLWAVSHHMRRGWVRPSLEDARELMRFGYLRTSVVGLSELGVSASRLVIGALLGYSALGLLNRAEKITTIFDRTIVEAMLPVLLPYLSMRVREGQGTTDLLERKVAMLSGMAWPFFLSLAIAAEPAVAILLGERWIEAVPVIRVLCLSGIVLPIGSGILSFLIAHDLLRAYLPLQIGMQLAVVGAAALGALVSIEAACLAFVLGQSLKAVAALGLLHRRAGLEPAAFLPGLRASAIVTATTGAAVYGTMQLPWELAAQGVAVIVAAASAWLAGVVVTRHPVGVELRRVARLGAVNGSALRRAWGGR